MVTQKKGLFKKAGKALGTVGNVLGILDAVNIVDKVSGHAAPIIDKAVERHYDLKKEMITVQNLTHLPIEQATTILENLGFIVVPILLKPDKKYASKTADEVITMVPKSGQLKQGSVIKLYYINQDNLSSSQELMAEQERKTKAFIQKMTDGLAAAKQAIPKQKQTQPSEDDHQ